MIPEKSLTEHTNSLKTSKTAPLQEVFSSIQGEGIHVGKRQVFVRFAHCHLKCAYCDTPMTTADGQCHVETPPGSGQIVHYPNPMQPATLVTIIEHLLQTTRHHSVSFTGGEPLLYHAFLKDVLPHVQQHAPTYLETSGTQPEFLEEILPWTDIIAMDIKLPSATQEPPQYGNHAAFYRVAQQKTCFVKIIFNNETTQEELDAVKAIVTNRQTPIILQPETNLDDRKVYLKPQRMLEIEQTLSAWFDDVRVIPQTHKMLNIL